MDPDFDEVHLQGLNLQITAVIPVLRWREFALVISELQRMTSRLELLKTIEQTLQNRALLERVFESQQLAKNRRFVDPTQTEPTREEMIKRMEKMVSVKLRRGTRLIDILVDHTDAPLTAAVANGLVKEFIRLNFEQNVAASEVANEFLSTESKILKLRRSWLAQCAIRFATAM